MFDMGMDIVIPVRDLHRRIKNEKARLIVGGFLPGIN